MPGEIFSVFSDVFQVSKKILSVICQELVYFVFTVEVFLNQFDLKERGISTCSVNDRF